MMKRTYLAASFIGICIIAFLGGILTGYIRHKADITPIKINTEEIKAVAREDETVTEREISEPGYYEVSVEGGDIILSEVFGDNKKNEIERAEINIAVLPQRDIELLEEGIIFYDKSEALIMMENFVS